VLFAHNPCIQRLDRVWRLPQFFSAFLLSYVQPVIGFAKREPLYALYGGRYFCPQIMCIGSGNFNLDKLARFHIFHVIDIN
jgi:hypothetical protein